MQRTELFRGQVVIEGILWNSWRGELMIQINRWVSLVCRCRRRRGGLHWVGAPGNHWESSEPENTASSLHEEGKLNIQLDTYLCLKDPKETLDRWLWGQQRCAAWWGSQRTPFPNEHRDTIPWRMWSEREKGPIYWKQANVPTIFPTYSRTESEAGVPSSTPRALTRPSCIPPFFLDSVQVYKEPSAECISSWQDLSVWNLWPKSESTSYGSLGPRYQGSLFLIPCRLRTLSLLTH